MLEQMVKSVMNKNLEEGFPHLKLPAVVFATISGATKLGDTYEVTELEITDEDAGRTFKASYKAFWYEYTLTVVDRFGNADTEFPELPGVRSKQQFEPGSIVAIGLGYGDITPSIIGEVVL